MTFEPFGDHANTSASELHLLHGTLPREVVCTENLTPFLKLLPCKGKAGISSLLDGHKLFDSTWQTMSIDVRPVCPSDQAECIMEIEQTVDMVLDIERSKRPRGKPFPHLPSEHLTYHCIDDPIPRPLPHDKLVCDTNRTYPDANHCYPLDLSETQSFTLKELFGRAIQGTCLSQQGPSKSPPPPVCITAPHSLDVFTTGGVTEHKSAAEPLSRCLSIPETGEFELLVPKQGPDHFATVSTPLLYAERSTTGHGQERGGVRILLTNPSPTEPVSFVYFETLPWFMKPYLHTLKSTISSLSTANSTVPRTNNGAAIKEMYYRPGLDRTRGSQLELLITIPASSTLELGYDFEKAILRYTEYPPDANRGRDVAPALIRLLPPVNNLDNTLGQGSSISRAGYIRTTSLMLPLPTPDFSMPYNVIILTSTVIALAFGTVYNMLVRRFIGADESEGVGAVGLVVGRLREGVKWVVGKVKGRLARRENRRGEEREKKEQ